MSDTVLYCLLLIDVGLRRLGGIRVSECRSTMRSNATNRAVPFELSDTAYAAAEIVPLSELRELLNLRRLHVASSGSEYMTTRQAAAYCGFKTTGALRKAHMEGRIRPAGRRGG